MAELLKVDVEKKFGKECVDLELVIPYLWGEIAVRFEKIYTYSQKIQLLGGVLVALSKDRLEAQIFVSTKLEQVIGGLIDMHRTLDRRAKPIHTFF